MTQPQADLFDIYRAGLKTAADLVKASLESAERMQNQQLVAIRSVIDQQSKSATELSRAKTLDELLSVQTRIVGQQFESAVSLWSDLCQAAGENQRVAIGRMQEQLAQARDWMASASLPLVVRQSEETKAHRVKA
ncbi:MAG: phasin family protein [Betaproteobacteria bacterium]|nr:phasin family protein [Betaproteobacteria bacterium]MBV9361533.1 phasin family protein [Betaproteobacteria bacterium]